MALHRSALCDLYPWTCSGCVSFSPCRILVTNHLFALQTLSGPTPDEDIARLRTYARRVRALGFHRRGRSREAPSQLPPRGIPLDADSLANLLLQTGLPLLPSLTKLELPVTPPYHSDPTFLLCPTLRDLTIVFPQHILIAVNDNITALFSRIFAQTPLLTHLRIQSERFLRHDPHDEMFSPWQNGNRNGVAVAPDDVFGTTFQVFCDALAAVAVLNDLEVFSMLTMNSGVIDGNLFLALSTLPRLRDCSFAIDIAPNTIPTVQAGFHALRTLALSNIVHGEELHLFDSPLLRDLTIYHYPHVSFDTYFRTLEVAVQRFPQLRRLTWRLGERELMPASPILGETVQPFFTFGDLQELFIDSVRQPFTDTYITFLVAALPRICHLELRFYMGKKGPGPSGRSLLSIAQGCPTLHTLHLDGIFFTQEDEANTETYPYVGNRLRCLNVADLRCEEGLYAAMIIDTFFPFLNIEECRRRAAKTYWHKGQYKAVLDRLETFHAARE